jgi:hypothetical protein
MTILAVRTYVSKRLDNGAVVRTQHTLARLSDGRAALIDPEASTADRPFVRQLLSEADLMDQLKAWPHHPSPRRDGSHSELTPQGVAWLQQAHARGRG